MKTDLKNWIGSIVTALILAFVKWVLSEFWRDESMRQHILSFLITFSPLLIGCLGFLLYWFIVFSRKVYETYIHYGQDREEMTKKINTYQDAVISLTNRYTTIDSRLEGVENMIKNKYAK